MFDWLARSTNPKPYARTVFTARIDDTKIQNHVMSHANLPFSEAKEHATSLPQYTCDYRLSEASVDSYFPRPSEGRLARLYVDFQNKYI